MAGLVQYQDEGPSRLSRGGILSIYYIHSSIKLPKKQGGTDELSNLTYICPNCHRIVHTNPKLLKNELVSFEEQSHKLNIDWKDYYYYKSTVDN